MDHRPPPSVVGYSDTTLGGGLWSMKTSEVSGGPDWLLKIGPFLAYFWTPGWANFGQIGAIFPKKVKNTENVRL